MKFYSSVILSFFFSFYNTDFAQTWALRQGVRILEFLWNKNKKQQQKNNSKKHKNFFGELLFK